MIKKSYLFMVAAILFNSINVCADNTAVLLNFDISGYSNVDGIGASFKTVLKNGYLPVKNSFENINGSTTEYIDMLGKGGFRADLPAIKNTITAEAWIKLDTSNNNTPIVVFYKEANTENDTNVDDLDRVLFEIDTVCHKGTPAVCVDSQITDLPNCEWSHLAFKISPQDGQYNIYINGVEKISGNIEGNISAADKVDLFLFNKKYTNGSLGNFTIYDESLIPSDLYEKSKNKYVSKNTASPIYVLPIEQSIAPNAPSIIQYTNINNNIIRVYKFDKNSSMTINNTEILNNQNMSIELWVKPELPQGFSYGNIFSLGEESDILMELYTRNGNMVFRPSKYNTRSMIASSIDGLSDYWGGWMHFVFSRSYNAISGQWVYAIYKDGSLIKSDAKFGISEDESECQLCLGASNFAKSFCGDIAMMKIYNSVLSSQEVLDHYKLSCKNIYPDQKVRVFDFEDEDDSIYSVMRRGENDQIDITYDSVGKTMALRLEKGNSEKNTYLIVDFTLPQKTYSSKIKVSYDIRFESNTDNKYKVLDNLPLLIGENGGNIVSAGGPKEMSSSGLTKSHGTCYYSSLKNDQYYSFTTLLDFDSQTYSYDMPNRTAEGKFSSDSENKLSKFRFKIYTCQGATEEPTIVWIDNFKIEEVDE